MRTYKIYFIRHGITQGNLEGKYVGSTDLPLCDEGVEEIYHLLDTCEYPKVGKVYTSPMIRCIETANLIYPDMTPELVDNIREYDFGEFENKPIEELMQNEKFDHWLKSGWKETLEGAENLYAFHERIIKGLDAIIMDMMSRHISDAAVITHGGVIMQLLSMCGLPKRKPYEWGVGNGRGYTLLVNASLWGNNKMAEVFTAVPYGDERTSEIVGYPSADEMREYDEWEDEIENKEV